jgi:hypothetical protein
MKMNLSGLSSKRHRKLSTLRMIPFTGSVTSLKTSTFSKLERLSSMHKMALRSQPTVKVKFLAIVTHYLARLVIVKLQLTIIVLFTRSK